MNKEGKVWGATWPLFRGPSIEIHRIEVNKDGYCSKHCHQSKFNAFYLIEGKLTIKRWKNDYDLVDYTSMKEGDLCIVPPGEFHQFIAPTPVKALEIYWSELDHNDIMRETVGGKSLSNVSGISK
jgi:quercetin dioxygenase-like cupin family protein